eukprot:11334635-Ditylum_brightwellii.AAC.1
MMLHLLAVMAFMLHLVFWGLGCVRSVPLLLPVRWGLAFCKSNVVKDGALIIHTLQMAQYHKYTVDDDILMFFPLNTHMAFMM